MKFPLFAWIAIGICLSFFAHASTIVEGSVFDAVTNTPIAGAQVEIIYFDGTISVLAQMTTGSDGAYEWSGDCYSVMNNPCDVFATAEGYAEAYVQFDGTLPVNPIDLALQRTSTVSGHVRRASDGSAIAGATVRVGDESAVSGTDGAYTVEGVVSGTYSACASVDQPLHLIPQCFDHLDYGALGGPPAYTPLDVVGGENVVDIDFDLVDGGTVSGTLTDGYLNRPIELGFGIATLYDLNGAFYAEYPFSTDTDGRYAFGGMPDGDYYVSVSISSVFIDSPQLYPGIACEQACSSPTQGRRITISNAGSVDGIDFVFHPDRVISGTVRDADTGEPMGSVPVTIFVQFTAGRWTTTDAVTGAYHVYIGGPTISYRAAAEPGTPFVNVSYPNAPCAGDADCGFAGEELLLDHGDIRDDIDFLVHKGAAVSGHVTNPLNGQPIATTVIGYDAAFNFIWSVGTQADGSYVSPAWPAGTFYVSATPTFVFPSLCAFYANRPCPVVGQDPSSVMPTPLVIGNDEIRPNIDFEFGVDEIFQDGFGY